MDARQVWYLSQLGVDRYVLRDPTPASLREVGGEVPASQPRGGLKNLLAEVETQAPLVGIEKGDLAPPVEQAEAPSPQEAEPTIEFSLACWSLGDEILVVNTGPRGWRPQTPDQQLLTAMLRAVGRQLQPRGVDFIDWPSRAGGDSSRSGAGIQVQMYLNGRVRKLPSLRYLWVMGKELALFALDGGVPAGVESAEEPRGRSLFVAPDKLRIFSLPALQDMIAEPSLKREAWERIRGMCDEPGG